MTSNIDENLFKEYLIDKEKDVKDKEVTSSYTTLVKSLELTITYIDFYRRTLNEEDEETKSTLESLIQLYNLVTKDSVSTLIEKASETWGNSWVDAIYGNSNNSLIKKVKEG